MALRKTLLALALGALAVAAADTASAGYFGGGFNDIGSFYLAWP